MKRGVYGLGLGLLLSGIYTASYSHGDDDHSPPVKTTLTALHHSANGVIAVPKESQFLLGIRTALAQIQATVKTLKINAKVIPHPRFTADVSAPHSGHVIGGRLPLVGQWVNKGEVLAVVQQPFTGPERLQHQTEMIKIQNQLRQTGLERDMLKPQLGLAQQEVQLAKWNLERLQKLNKVIAKEEIPIAELAYAKAKVNVRKTEQELLQLQHLSQSLQQELRHYRTINAKNGKGLNQFAITAPVSGLVAESQVVMGLKVEPSQRLFEIINPTVRWIEAYVYETDLPQLEHVTHGVVKALVYPHETLPARLIAVAQKINEHMRTANVIFEVVNHYRHLKVGMFAQVYIDTHARSQQVVIPTAAVYEKSGHAWIFIHTAAETFELREIQPGAVFGRFTAIKNGLKAGERVVIQGTHQLFAMTGHR